jgi:hypothetical protein
MSHARVFVGPAGADVVEPSALEPSAVVLGDRACRVDPVAVTSVLGARRWPPRTGAALSRSRWTATGDRPNRNDQER